MSSLSPRAAADLASADAYAARRKRAHGRTFTCLVGEFGALEWYWRMRGALQAPKGVTLPTPDDVDVDGGRGGDIDETHATLITIHDALEALRKRNPRGHGILVLAERDGKSLRAIAERTGLGVGTVSAELGKAQGLLAGWLLAEGVLR